MYKELFAEVAAILYELDPWQGTRYFPDGGSSGACQERTEAKR
jgi:hypothetical protein